MALSSRMNLALLFAALLAAVAVVSVQAETTEDPRSLDNLAVFAALNHALLCLDNKTATCPPGGYLNETGIIPKFSTTDAQLYCTGGCANQTLVQLKCVGDVYRYFRFNNNALVSDIRDTVKAACDPSSILYGNFTIKVTPSSGANLAPIAGVTLLSVVSAILFL
ncbi:hypothetical protein R1sor_012315 [Riccia sorocarpa]|uniref:DUF7731 domain-containing protein n=1 Tax=Riccia sorocarpa TaxID=122646 RepID=A0ABD3I9M1_9MARC